VRILIFHGYLLRGTGSNIYNASLIEALASLGHEVHILCQDRSAAELPLVGATGRWEDGELLVDGDPGARITAYLPDIGRVLPVYVADQYEGFDAKRFLDLTDAELGHYIDSNVRAVREVAQRVRPDIALANHALMGPVILARALTDEVPYAVKIHGSALEYTLRPDPERFLPYARERVNGARGVLVGSRHMAEVLWEFLPETRDRSCRELLHRVLHAALEPSRRRSRRGKGCSRSATSDVHGDSARWCAPAPTAAGVLTRRPAACRFSRSRPLTGAIA